MAGNLSNRKKSIPITSNQLSNPFARMQAVLDKTIEDFYSAFEFPSFSSKEFENLAISPAMDIVDDKDQFKIEVEMPGMSEENVQVSISEGILTIKGEKESSRQDRDKNYLLREISYGSCERSIRLPDSVDIDKAKASFKKGMLWVEIPKKPESSKKNRTLKIEKA
ncbi:MULTISPECIES: Hsp20/alpha crystallin family protein [unclassified Legionella]|uniref:Hsp20/alpha crystallin family protein n=1 Tax=unclassified Legionella TaxID=2622702 RepID=UPI0010564722|nr:MULTISPECIES: Hsp20/alpha crystallin family protein [unclassified Legionella]MDI9818378.1 Hsp20/alpha crystallin family protein [Legionella sp. PL877]